LGVSSALLSQLLLSRVVFGSCIGKIPSVCCKELLGLFKRQVSISMQVSDRISEELNVHLLERHQ
jgi:hypothetical protein